MLTVKIQGMDKLKRKLQQMQRDLKQVENRRFSSRQQLENEVRRIIRK